MRDTIVVYLKPTCSKCRETLKLLKARGIEFESVNYYETPLSVPRLDALLKKLGLSARDLLRKDEPVAPQLGIGQKDFSEAELIKLMVQHPDLMQRPIVVRGNKAILGRPVENLERLL